MQKWSEVTREERFFTALLYHAIAAAPKPMARVVQSKLRLPGVVRIVDVGYEVCFFRDAWLRGLIQRRRKDLEKQTFDLVLRLSDESMVIVEAKAQQGFDMRQTEKLHDARTIIQDEKYAKRVFILGLHSSQYTPRRAGSEFDGLITWEELARETAYAEVAGAFGRADSIYRDSARRDKAS